MNKYFINSSQIDQVLQRQDGAFFVSCTDGMTFLVPNQESNRDFHTLEVWQQDGGVLTVISAVSKSGDPAVAKSGDNYTITTQDGRTIPVVSNRDEPTLEESWIQIWAGLGGGVTES